jgi:flagellar protein FlaG
MKFDGMEAAAKTLTAPVVSYPQPQIKVSPPGGAKVKSGESAGEPVTFTGRPIGKPRGGAADSQSFETLFQQRDDDVSEELINEALERANRAITGSDRKFERSVHEKTRDIMVKVVDTVTNETIREIPPKKIVDLVASLCEIAGILFDEKG